MNLIRSLIFNLFFYGITFVLSILYLPLLALPRKQYLAAVRFWERIVDVLERLIMGISYEVRGLEHLPKEGSYLIAAKHQSAYETLKLHLLFDDPAIILKKELLYIPLWGMHLAKADVIAIDRSTPEKALQSIEEGAKRMAAQGRPIIIFPQGTRVKTTTTPAQKPYKAGIARTQEATALPVIPMALNSGYFWPKNSFLKRPGKVIFEFLEPIPAGSMNRKSLMNHLETKIEAASQKLVKEAGQPKSFDLPPSKGPIFMLVCALLLVICIGLYTSLWFTAAKQVRLAHQQFMEDLVGPERSFTPPVISGFPGPLQVKIAQEYIQSHEGTLTIKNLQAQSWPMIRLPIHVQAGEIMIESFKWPESLSFTDLDSNISVNGDQLTIHDGEVKSDSFTLGIAGTVDFAQKPIPKLDVEVALINHADFIGKLAAMGLLETRTALFTSAGLNALADDDGIVRVPLRQRNQTLYAGPIPVATLPDLPALHNSPDPDL